MVDTISNVTDVENLTDEEARQSRYTEGDHVMRVTRRHLNVPGRAIKDGRIFLVAGEQRTFENQDTNLVELTTEAAIRFEDAVEDAVDEDMPLDDFVFEVEVADLTLRKAQYVHAPFAEPRVARYADEPHWAKPIVGLDVDADGAAIDMKALRKSVRKHLRSAETVTSGFTAATGGAFEE